MITKKRLIISALLLLGLSLVILYNGRVEVLVANELLRERANGNETLLNRFTGGIFQDTPEGGSIDTAGSLFVGGKPRDPADGKTIVRYMNEANAAIPLTTEALQFALMQFVLGDHSLIEDAIVRLREGRIALERMNPPTDALVFHKMSIKLLDEYQTVMRIPLEIPREEFRPEELEDDFTRLDSLVAITKHELQLLSRAYGVPLFSNVIRFYNEAIGLRKR